MLLKPVSIMSKNIVIWSPFVCLLKKIKINRFTVAFDLAAGFSELNGLSADS